MGYVYVLKLEKGKYYIGYTERQEYERLEEHFSNEGSKWTKKFRPVEVLSFRSGTTDDENSTTLEYMKNYGWWNVRGGQHCEVNMEQPPKELQNNGIWNWVSESVTGVHNFITHLGETWSRDPGQMCYRCGRQGHFVRQCYAKVHANGEKLAEKPEISICSRCGRNSHTVKNCYAKTHLNGSQLN